MTGRRVGTIGLATAALLLTGACSFDFSVGGGSVDKDAVAAQAMEVLTPVLPQTPESVTCFEDLPAEVGAEIRCDLRMNGQTYGVTVTTTSVQGNDVRFDAVVDESQFDTANEDAVDDVVNEPEPNSGGLSVDKDAVATQAMEVLAPVLSQTPESVTCFEDLPAEVGAEIYCELFMGGQTYGVTVTTTSVQGDDVWFDAVVDDEPLG